jgi:phosphoribosylaminoimidazole-succinocarboxamide synthase
LALFARDRFMTADRGLTLVDTKYDFGADGNSNITVVNEIH